MSERQPLPLSEMDLLDFVQWDRYTETDIATTVFGWIDRPDGHADFVVLRNEETGLRIITSSAEHDIGAILNDGEPTGNHAKCKRVQNHPDAWQLGNVIRIAELQE